MEQDGALEAAKMKVTIFLLIFIGISLFYFIPLTSALQSNIIPYNFTNLSDRNAYSGYPSASQPFNGTSVANNYGNTSAANYTNLQTRDAVFANQSSHGSADEPFWRFNFTVKDAQNHRANIQWLTVNVTGKGRIGTGTELGVVEIYNFSSDLFVTIGTFTATNANYSMNYTENINATDFIQSSSGNVTVYIEGENTDAGELIVVDFVQVDIMYTSDVEPPQWSNNMTNSTLAGTTINHSANWTDDVGFSGYIFSFNNGNGTFYNDTWAPMTSDNWTNVSKVANSTAGSIINWTVYVNDSSNNWNVTGNFNYTTTGAADSCSCPAENSNWLIINGDQCVLSTSCNLGTGRLRIMNGALRIANTGVLNSFGCFVNSGSSFFVINGGKLICR